MNPRESQKSVILLSLVMNGDLVVVLFSRSVPDLQVRSTRAKAAQTCRDLLSTPSYSLHFDEEVCSSFENEATRLLARLIHS